MGSERINSYDVSPKMREIIEWKSARRKQLRDIYLKQILHPTKQEMVNDRGIERFAIMRITHEYQAKLTGRTVLLGFGITYGTIFLSMWIVKVAKDREEHMYRTGQVSYADREYKFNN